MKQLQSINTFAQNYDYIITLINAKKTLPPFWELNTPYLKRLESLSHMHCAKFGWKLPFGSGEDDFKILIMYLNFLYFGNISIPLEKSVAKLESPSSKDALC